MRTHLKWALPVLVLAVLAYLGWGFTNKLNHKQQVAKRIQTLPDFTAYSIDRSEISSAALSNRPAVLIYFDPDCDHCQREAAELQKKAASLASAQVLMLSSAPAPALKTFAKTHKINNLPNVQVAHIDKQTAYETFGFTSVPDVLIYHADGSLAKHFRGETSIEVVARHL
ncbi:peroxiredoxin family protein [Spirosoma areae]